MVFSHGTGPCRCLLVPRDALGPCPANLCTPDQHVAWHSWLGGTPQPYTGTLLGTSRKCLLRCRIRVFGKDAILKPLPTWCGGWSTRFVFDLARLTSHPDTRSNAAKQIKLNFCDSRFIVLDTPRVAWIWSASNMNDTRRAFSTPLFQ